MFNAEDTWLYSAQWSDTAFLGDLPECLTGIANIPGVPYSDIVAAWIEAQTYGFYQNDIFWIGHESKAVTRL